MYCIIIGFKITGPQAVDCADLPSSVTDDLRIGYTDFEEWFIGYSVLDQGFNGIEPLSGPIDLEALARRINNLGSKLALISPMIAEIHTIELTDPPDGSPRD